MRKNLLLLVCSLLAAVSFAVVTGIVNPAEKVNALWIVVAAASVYVIAYRLYASWIAAKVLAINEQHVTPAYRLYDGMDYEPTNRWVLFGHHFAAIAGAGPLIGPMLAAQFGYLPGFLWILIGSVLAGAVHDMVILAASVRRNGRSLAQIAKDEVGPVGGLAASIAIFFIIIVALAGLGLAVVNAMAHSPWSTWTIFLTIPIALGMGFYMRGGKASVEKVSVIGGILLLAAVGTGHFIPGSALEGMFTLTRNQLIIAIAIYGFIASVLPVWMLLAPRDYLSTFMKIGTVGILALGVVFIAPSLEMPAIMPFVNGGGPIIPGQVYPFMFITIACGAVSGFHALISSGTSPKMLMNERDIPLIGYGAMLAEGFVAMIALVAACILIPGDYFAINTRLTLEQIAALGFPVAHINELSALVQTDVQGRPGGAVSLAVGMASILSAIPGMTGLMPYWYNFALMFEALFILTTVDAGTRVARFLLQEMAAKVVPPLGRKNWLPGIAAASGIVVLMWAYPLWSGDVSTIWPMFGVANQLLSAIAFGVGTTVIIKARKARYAWITALPMAFMYVTTLAASYYLVGIFNAKAAAAPSQAFAFHLNVALLALICTLALVSLIDMLVKWYGYLSGNREIITTEDVATEPPSPGCTGPLC